MATMRPRDRRSNRNWRGHGGDFSSQKAWSNRQRGTPHLIMALRIVMGLLSVAGFLYWSFVVFIYMTFVTAFVTRPHIQFSPSFGYHYFLFAPLVYFLIILLTCLHLPSIKGKVGLYFGLFAHTVILPIVVSALIFGDFSIRVFGVIGVCFGVLWYWMYRRQQEADTRNQKNAGRGVDGKEGSILHTAE